MRCPAQVIPKITVNWWYDTAQLLEDMIQALKNSGLYQTDLLYWLFDHSYLPKVEAEGTDRAGVKKRIKWKRDGY